MTMQTDLAARKQRLSALVSTLVNACLHMLVLSVLAGAYQGPQQVAEMYRNLLLAAVA